MRSNFESAQLDTMKRRYIALIVLSLITLASWMLLRPTVQTAKDSDATELTDGYYLIDAQISDFDTNGRALYALQAARIDHFPADDSVQLDQLRIAYSDTSADAAPSDTPIGSDDGSKPSSWLISAAQGSMGAARDRLILSGDVKIIGKLNDQGRETIVSTQRLILEIAANQAHTTDDVTIEMAEGQLTAKGMQADLSLRTFSLLSNVQGKFKPEP